jgi:hypothetical protein
MRSVFLKRIKYPLGIIVLFILGTFSVGFAQPPGPTSSQVFGLILYPNGSIINDSYVAAYDNSTCDLNGTFTTDLNVNSGRYSINVDISPVRITAIKEGAGANTTSLNVGLNGDFNEVNLTLPLHDLIDEKHPGGTWSTTDTVLLNGSGWESNQTFQVNITYPNRSTAYDEEHSADTDGSITGASRSTSTFSPAGTYAIYASIDACKTWLKYDDFPTADLPEFPLGASIVILSSAAVYWQLKRGFKK